VRKNATGKSRIGAENNWAKMPHGPTKTGWEDDLPDELFDIYTLECANKKDLEACGEDCSITVPRAYLRVLGGPEVLAIMYRWQVLSHACSSPLHPVHHLYFCSAICLANWSARAKAEIMDEESEESQAEKRGD
jgi:hypothetical protein